MAIPTRREFLAATGALAAAPALARSSRPPPREKKRVLILGGTSYLGPAVVGALIERGHEVTLFNRGRSNPHLFPGLEKRVGQRRRPEYGGRGVEQDLSALESGEWDAVVDTSAYFPRNVEDVATLLADRVGHYVCVSSISVYAELGKTTDDIDENSPLGTLDDKYAEKQITNENYGPLKAYCEQAAEEVFAGRTTVVRPGYIIGPGDPFDRLTSRVMRLAKGGDTLAPGTPDAELQMIDVRDLGAFIADTAVEGIAGRFNATGYEAHVSVEEFHHACKLTFAHDTTLEWVSDEFLLGEKVTPWVDLACWTPDSMRNHCKVERAIEAGLEFRPVVDTVRDTHEWAVTERGERPWRAGLKPEREAELLEAWRAR